MKKFELTGNFKMCFGRKLFQIRALISIKDVVREGETGGYIEKEENLDQTGDAWVYGNARVSGDARVYGNAWVYGDAWVYGNARVSGDADILQVTGLGTVHRTTTVYKTKNGIKIVCGCFRGGIEAFKAQVVNTRSGKVRDEYLKFAELIEIYFGIKEKEEQEEDE